MKSCLKSQPESYAPGALDQVQIGCGGIDVVLSPVRTAELARLQAELLQLQALQARMRALRLASDPIKPETVEAFHRIVGYD